jgi:two-component system, NtrC family, response regulator HydG
VPHTKPAARVLIVDADAATASALADALSSRGYATASSTDGEDALEVVEGFRPHAIVIDESVCARGTALSLALRRRHPERVLVALSAAATIESAVRNLRAGAAHYLDKPVDLTALSEVLAAALEDFALSDGADPLHVELRETLSVGLGPLIGASDAMQRIFADARRVAQSRSTVLITGESGTGKGQLAEVIHALSPRREAPFVTVTCASLAETLIESELFGHEKGAFTGAERQRIGRFEEARGGTIFLDEVSEIPAATQVKLLRVLQERAFERVGGSETIAAEVRLIGATNRDLAKAVRRGEFREDLYYRLRVVGIELPPLRERDGDVLLLARHLLARHARVAGKRIVGFAPAALAYLSNHDWPGNVRELDNAIERAVVLCRGQHVPRDCLPMPAGPSDPLTIPGATLEEIERHAILTTLEATGGSTTKAAEILGISPRTIQHRLKSWGMARPRGRRPIHRRGATDAWTDAPPPSGRPANNGSKQSSRNGN